MIKLLVPSLFIFLLQSCSLNFSPINQQEKKREQITCSNQKIDFACLEQKINQLNAIDITNENNSFFAFRKFIHNEFSKLVFKEFATIFHTQLNSVKRLDIKFKKAIYKDLILILDLLTSPTTSTSTSNLISSESEFKKILSHNPQLKISDEYKEMLWLAWENTQTASLKFKSNDEQHLYLYQYMKKIEQLIIHPLFSHSSLINKQYALFFRDFFEQQYFNDIIFKHHHYSVPSIYWTQESEDLKKISSNHLYEYYHHYVFSLRHFHTSLGPVMQSDVYAVVKKIMIRFGHPDNHGNLELTQLELESIQEELKFYWPVFIDSKTILSLADQMLPSSDHNGFVNQLELSEFLLKLIEAKLNNKNYEAVIVSEAFSRYDLNKDGHLDFNELKQMTVYEKKFETSELAYLLRYNLLPKDGSLSFFLFKTCLNYNYCENKILNKTLITEKKFQSYYKKKNYFGKIKKSPQVKLLSAAVVLLLLIFVTYYYLRPSKKIKPTEVKKISHQFAHLKPLTILVVDHIKEDRENLKKLLKDTPHKVVTAVDGADALFKFTKVKCDVVFIALQLSVVDGLTTTQKLREIEAQGNGSKTKIPIIALTEYSLGEDVETCFLSGCSDYLSLPIQPEELYSMLTHIDKYLMQDIQITVDKKTPPKTVEMRV